MSRVHHFSGSVDAPYPGMPKHVHAMVYGTTGDTPSFGFVVIPLKAFPKTQRNKIQDGDKIEGRYCPRSLRVKLSVNKRT